MPVQEPTAAARTMDASRGGRWGRFAVCLVSALVLAAAGSGCASYILATRLVKAPNQQMSGMRNYVKNWEEAQRQWASRTYQVPVGADGLKLAVAVIEPADYGFDYQLGVNEQEAGVMKLKMRFEIDRPIAEVTILPAQHTIIALHGMYSYKEVMVPWALFLAERGYRVVLVDLPGHGDSTGNRISFGRWERESLRTLLDELVRRGETVGEVGVLGVSYGASVGLQWAAVDPRIRTVVALEPYSDPSRAVLGVARGQFRETAARFSDETFVRALQRSQRLGRFTWNEVDVVAAVARLEIPVLFIHGGNDQWVTPDQSEALHAAAGAESQLRIVPNEDHVTLPLRVNELGPAIADWFGARLRTAAAQPGADADAPAGTDSD